MVDCRLHVEETTKALHHDGSAKADNCFVAPELDAAQSAQVLFCQNLSMSRVRILLVLLIAFTLPWQGVAAATRVHCQANGWGVRRRCRSRSTPITHIMRTTTRPALRLRMAGASRCRRRMRQQSIAKPNAKHSAAAATISDSTGPDDRSGAIAAAVALKFGRTATPGFEKPRTRRVRTSATNLKTP